MSAFHNNPAGERLATRAHVFFAGVGVLHVLIGIGIIAWHLRGARDHRENLRKLEGKWPSCS